MSLAETIFLAAERFNRSVCEEEAEALAAYLRLLHKWNASYNLTAVRDVNDMVERHVLDALFLRPFLRDQRILDVGTGAGIPGLVLALVERDRHWLLLDRNGKKIRFLNAVLRELSLTHVETVQCDVRSYQPAGEIDTLVARAFASLPKLLEDVQHLMGPACQLLAMKGPHVDNELQALPLDVQVHGVETYRLPAQDVSHCVVRIQSQAPREQKA